MQTSVKVFILGVLLCISLVTALQFGANFIPLDQIISAIPQGWKFTANLGYAKGKLSGTEASLYAYHDSSTRH